LGGIVVVCMWVDEVLCGRVLFCRVEMGDGDDVVCGWLLVALESCWLAQRASRVESGGFGDALGLRRRRFF
jgi:hypothetical protein